MTVRNAAQLGAACLLRRAAPAAIALVLALLARHLVVEPAHIAHACDPEPWAGWCAARTLLIVAFSTHAIGWISLGAGIAATLTRSRLAAQVALVAGSAGLVLYSFERSAFGALLGLLVLARIPCVPGRRPATQAPA